MKDKECKIVCDGTEIGTISHKKGEIVIKAISGGKKLCCNLSEDCC